MEFMSCLDGEPIASRAPFQCRPATSLAITRRSKSGLPRKGNAYADLEGSAD